MTFSGYGKFPKSGSKFQSAAIIGFHTHLRYVKISIWGLVPENQGKITTVDALNWGIPHFETDPCENPNPYIPFWKDWGEWGYGSWWGYYSVMTGQPHWSGRGIPKPLAGVSSWKIRFAHGWSRGTPFSDSANTEILKNGTLHPPHAMEKLDPGQIEPQKPCAMAPMASANSWDLWI